MGCILHPVFKSNWFARALLSVRFSFRGCGSHQMDWGSRSKISLRRCFPGNVLTAENFAGNWYDAPSNRLPKMLKLLLKAINRRAAQFSSGQKGCSYCPPLVASIALNCSIRYASCKDFKYPALPCGDHYVAFLQRARATARHGEFD